MLHSPSMVRLLAALGIFLLPGLAAFAQAPAKPAVLFTGSHGGSCGYQVAGKLAAAGFNLNTSAYPGLQRNALTPDVAKKYNVIVIAGLSLANADMTLPPKVAQTIETLRQYLEAGGGVLIFSSFGQMATEKPPQDALFKPLGLTPLFDEMPFDPETSVTATSWKIPFAYADGITPSPITAGLKGLWYPVPSTRIGAQNHTTPFAGDNTWTVLVRGGKSSLTKKGELQQDATDPGTYQSGVPLVAMKQVGKGRIMYVGMTAEYLTGGVAMSTLEGIVLERGLKGRPSGGYQLLENGLKWLAEPSFTAGNFGGAGMDANLLANPHKTKFGQPFPWSEKLTFPEVEKAYPGVIGARSAYSSGKGTVDEWVAKAKAQGLSYLVFLEEFRRLSAGNFDKLKADCMQLSTPEFSVIPGFTIDDEVGNHYFYFGTTFPYPDKTFLSADGTVFRARDKGLNVKDPYIPGQLAMTVLDYAYSISSFKLTCGNYLFSQDAAPFADFFSDWDAVGVVTAQNGKVEENATRDFLTMVDSGQGPLPLAFNFMEEPGQLANAKWRTVLRFPVKGGTMLGGMPIEQATKVRDYFNDWHMYPDNPSRIYITSGPEIESWSYTGSRDYGGDNNGDFVWQNYRWPVYGKVKSAVGLKEVAVYDGVELFRRYLPGGKTEFEFTLDLNHDKQHNLALVVTDLHGNTAVGGEQWDRNHRLEETQCGDRNNQLSYGYSTNKDGIGVLLGGNQTLATPIKRVVSHISPSGTFKNDALLGAPAFDGATGGEPEVIEVVGIRGTEKPVPSPSVNDHHRLLHTGDVNIGDGVREHYFTDNVAVYNVWHTLWKTAPAAYHVTRRNHFFQINPDSPLAVFLWQIDITLQQDLPNKGFDIALMTSREDKLWAFRSSDGSAYAGTWEDTARSNNRYLNLSFDKDAYAAFLDSPLGGAAIFPLTDGQESSVGLPQRNRLIISLPAASAPQKKGETKRVSLLILGIPRLTDNTKNLPSASTEVVERFYHDFGLDGKKTGYTIDAKTGTIISRRYILDIDGAQGNAFSGILTGNLISSLPITVSNLNDRWSACLYDRTLKKTRPLGMFEGKAWATVCLTGRQDLFIGHPVTADDRNLTIQLTQRGDNAWSLEVHNPTDKPITTTLHKNPFFDPLQGKTLGEEKVTIPAGSSVVKVL
ncbi:MAG: hypothetical protein ACYDBB_26855 [Armatimonadota bacterium]